VDVAALGDLATGPPRAGVARVLAAAGRPELLAAVLEHRERCVKDEVVERCHPVRGVETVLGDIPARLVRFAVVSADSRTIADAVLARFGWTWRFEAVIGHEDVAAVTPDPAPYHLACERLGLLPAQALAVAGSSSGLAAARAAGCRTAAIVATGDAEVLTGAEFTLSNVGALPGLLSLLG
jgi:phosphoglycolate phosphatase